MKHVRSLFKAEGFNNTGVCVWCRDGVKYLSVFYLYLFMFVFYLISIFDLFDSNPRQMHMLCYISSS